MKTILINVIMNLVVTAIFVTANGWAVGMQLEETFISLAILFGFTITIINAAYLIRLKQTTSK